MSKPDAYDFLRRAATIPEQPKETPSQKADRIYAEQHPMKPAPAPAERLYAWHFVPSNLKLAHSGEPVEVGRTYHVEGKIIPCENGLHGSVRLLDALAFASSSILTRCSYGGEIVHESDKLAASERTILWLGDIDQILHEAACVFAEGALRIGKVTDPRSWAAIEAKRKWLRGEITDKELAAAGDVAWVFAGDVAWDAARVAAWDAAWAAARVAAGNAADAAVRDAARVAAWDAARDTAWDAQNDYLECAVREFAGVDQ
jgi:hypothetical protein